MAREFSIPEGFEDVFRRIVPYLMAPLQNEPKVLESLLIFYKLGGEKMTRIVIDALNVTRRMENTEMIRKLREEAMLLEEDDNLEEDNGDDDDEDDEEDEEVS